MEYFNLKGRVICNPNELTNKHKEQSTWKKVIFIQFADDDLLGLYSWFIRKRYNLELFKPLREPHLTIINDSFSEMNLELMDDFMAKYESKEMVIEVSVSPRTNGKHWWLPISQKSKDELLSIRKELGLGAPFSGFHITLGTPKTKHIEFSNYIHEIIKHMDSLK